MKLAIVAGELSGDALGARLMEAIRARQPDVTFMGVGGPAMRAQGLESLFPLADIAVMGILPVLARLRLLFRRIRETAQAASTAGVDGAILIDSEGFTRRVAARIHAADPRIAIIQYVSPSVWAWRPGRAKAMSGFVDLILALLPFEPEAHVRLGGPRCVYVGHPLIERLADLRPSPPEAERRDASPPLLLALPGSRRSEITRLMPVFGAALALLESRIGAFECVLPAVAHHRALIEFLAAQWSIPVTLLDGDEAKFAAFRTARAALAASGTVTLELALAGVPAVVAYKVSGVEAAIARRVVTVPTVVLPNLILGENAYPEFLQEACTPEALAEALAPLVRNGQDRARQLAMLARLDARMLLDTGETPSARAAREALAVIEQRKR